MACRPAPVPQPELGQHPADVGLDGRLADVQLMGDLGVGPAPGDQLQHLPLPVGQAVQVRRGAGVVGARANSANSAIRRRVTDGAISPSPEAIVRTASTSPSGEVCLSRNPQAPARRASKTYSST